MVNEFEVRRKLQEQSGSYFVFLPKLWVKSLNLKEGDIMKVRFNGGVRIDPSEIDEQGGGNSNEDV
jgi:antitoxin component of MazEF toxin-antitoxin module